MKYMHILGWALTLLTARSLSAEQIDYFGRDANARSAVVGQSSWGQFELEGIGEIVADVTLDTEHPFLDGNNEIVYRPAIRFNHARAITGPTATFTSTASFLVPGTLNEFKELSVEITFDQPAIVDAFGARSGRFQELHHVAGTVFEVAGFEQLNNVENVVATVPLVGSYRITGSTETKEGTIGATVTSIPRAGYLEQFDTASFPSSISIVDGASLGGFQSGGGTIQVDGIDVFLFVSGYGAGVDELPLHPRTDPLGDTDLNGVIDMDDLNNVRNNFSFGRALGDTDGNGVVDLIDLNNVRNHFGLTAPQAVPEPASIVLVFVGLVLCVGRSKLSPVTKD